jgi:hypothetical protein
MWTQLNEELLDALRNDPRIGISCYAHPSSSSSSSTSSFPSCPLDQLYFYFQLTRLFTKHLAPILGFSNFGIYLTLRIFWTIPSGGVLSDMEAKIDGNELTPRWAAKKVLQAFLNQRQGSGDTKSGVL